jgi:hypothetical protein
LEFIRGLRDRLNLKAKVARHQALVCAGGSTAALWSTEARVAQEAANECDIYMIRREAELTNGRRP